jgi:colicin import membrane protein
MRQADDLTATSSAAPPSSSPSPSPSLSCREKKPAEGDEEGQKGEVVAALQARVAELERELDEARTREPDAPTPSEDTTVAEAAEAGELKAQLAGLQDALREAEARAAAAEHAAVAAAGRATADMTSKQALEDERARALELEHTLAAAQQDVAQGGVQRREAEEARAAAAARVTQLEAELAQAHDAMAAEGDAKFEAVSKAAETERAARLDAERCLETERANAADLLAQCEVLGREVGDKDSAIEILVHQVEEVRRSQ